MTDWILLHYKLPAQPSALRVYVWRKLKRLGAILLNETVWVLPDSPRSAEQFQWLSAEIQERGGESYLWKANLALGMQDDELVVQFTRQTDAAYKALLKKLDKKNPDPVTLSREYQQIASRDYFHSALGQQAREKLLALRGATK